MEYAIIYKNGKKQITSGVTTIIDCSDHLKLVGKEKQILAIINKACYESISKV